MQWQLPKTTQTKPQKPKNQKKKNNKKSCTIKEPRRQTIKKQPKKYFFCVCYYSFQIGENLVIGCGIG